MQYMYVPNGSVLLQDSFNDYCLFLFPEGIQQNVLSWFQSAVRMRVVVLWHGFLEIGINHGVPDMGISHGYPECK